MIVREIKTSDAEKLSHLTQQVEGNSEYMLWEAGERNSLPAQQRKMIESIEEEGNSTILVAETGNKLVGFLMAFGGKARRNKHSAYIVIGILKEYRGQGIGSKLLEELERWALCNNIHRLELTVVTQNESGLSLYRKMGFTTEGTKKHSLFIDGDFVDEYYMSKLL
ncbi:GNAT family N-acetyltransferase [Virgibacillus salinus]|uniref:Protein N-acetyltransferase, RimJ/RimL family n=1 Tax=Virgibacillus salinus TaxID=553311 RepID=A0A1H1DUL7_9BACI|nr:GNAT family N-acetyltransferase [Virgibacillus salinus]SDQ79918.1 Protein N-acetyltransferase, RimJ/RimL family [Virgibacillus salinus]